MTDANADSILDAVKKVLGFDPDYTAFDLDIIIHINSAFGSLLQLGVSNDITFVITDNTTLWETYTANLGMLNLVKQYIYLSVKLAFDTPGTSFAIDAIKDQLAKLEWRINILAEEISPPSVPGSDELGYGPSTYVTDDDPGDVPDGSIWFDPQLAEE
jgi:hypothetical protein